MIGYLARLFRVKKMIHKHKHINEESYTYVLLT